MKPRPGARLKLSAFTVRASRGQAARWSFWAAEDGARSVGVWLERLADAEVLRRETERGVYDPLPVPRLL